MHNEFALCVSRDNTTFYTTISHHVWESCQYNISAPRFQLMSNGIGDVIVSVITSSAVDRGFQLRSGQTKGYEIGICCFFAKHAALSKKTKDWLSRNQNNMSE
jgi:hypothetical protein